LPDEHLSLNNLTKPPDGTSIVVYEIERIDRRARPPFKIGDVLYAVNGVLFTSLDGMPRYVESLAPGSTATVDFLQAPPKRWQRRAVPMEQMPAVSATVQIFSTYSSYARPPGPPLTPEQKRREDLHVAKMAAAGYATGTVIQAILDALGVGPGLAGPIFDWPREFSNGGMTPAQRNNAQGREPSQKSPEFNGLPPAINRGVHGNGPGAR
jgi:hypothetical protein